MHNHQHYKSLSNCVAHSENIIEEIRRSLEKLFDDHSFCIVTTGSYARGEASIESDLDWLIVTKEKIPTETFQNINEKLKQFVEKDTGSTGTFESQIIEADLFSNFGGEKDNNKSFTRRMLLLLESKWLYNQSFFNQIKKRLLEIYIKKTIPDDHINKFFLNDIIRYYRTMCTDFEYKVSEGGKTWGVRNIKLRFSRKLLYFSGIIVVAETCYLERNKKITRSLELLEKTPLERVMQIDGWPSEANYLNFYDTFLESISNPEIRKNLDSVIDKSRNENNTYRDLKNLSQHFSWELSKFLRKHYDINHPIHHSLVL